MVATGISGLSDEEFPPTSHPSPRKCGVVQVYDADSGRRLQRVETFGDVTKVGFSKDGTLIAWSRLFTTADGIALNEVRLVEVTTRETHLVFDRCHAFDFCPDGKHVVVASRKRCVVYDLDTGDKVQTFNDLGGALSLACSRDGAAVAGIVSTDSGFAIRICDRASGDVRESPMLEDPFYSLAFSPNGDLASGHVNGNVILWDSASLIPRSRFNSGGHGLQHPFFSPNGGILGAGDQHQGDVVFWDLSTGEEVARYTFEKGGFHTYHTRDRDERIKPEKDPHRFAFSPDGTTFLSGPYGGIIRVVATGQDTKRYGE